MLHVGKSQGFGSLQEVPLRMLVSMGCVGGRLVIGSTGGLVVYIGVVGAWGVVVVRVFVLKSVLSGNIDGGSVFGVFELRSGCQVVLLIVRPGFGAKVDIQFLVLFFLRLNKLARTD